MYSKIRHASALHTNKVVTLPPVCLSLSFYRYLRPTCLSHIQLKYNKVQCNHHYRSNLLQIQYVTACDSVSHTNIHVYQQCITMWLLAIRTSRMHALLACVCASLSLSLCLWTLALKLDFYQSNFSASCLCSCSISRDKM